MTGLADLIQIARELGRPVASEVRVGSLPALNALKARFGTIGPEAAPRTAFLGIPIYIDEALEPNVIEIRDQHGAVMTHVELQLADVWLKP